MGLVLAASYSDQTRQQIEDHLSIIRSRRMSAAMEYQVGLEAKAQQNAAKVQKKLETAYAALQRRLEASEKTETALAEALQKCETLRQEYDLIVDLGSAGAV